ncbi:MAG: HEPN domain-containing protein [Armatimonadia bacterium]
MPPEPGSPAEWLAFAASDLGIVRGPVHPDVLMETRAFHAQQVVEKCLKAVLLSQGVEFPRTHNLGILYELLPSELKAAPEVEEATELSVYSVAPRYPGESEPVSADEFVRIAQLAEAVMEWAYNTVTASDA